MMKTSIFDRYDDVLITSNWRWVPSKAGGWDLRGEGTRQKVIEKTSDPFIVLVYQNKNSAHFSDKTFANRLRGFLIVSHEALERDKCNAPNLTYEYKQGYRKSLKAIRAFEFNSDSRLSIDDFAPEIREQDQMVHQLDVGIAITASQLSVLRKLSYTEVPLFGNTEPFLGETFIGNFNQSLISDENEHHLIKFDEMWLTSFWGFHPPSWGCVGFHDEGRREKIIELTDDPFLMAIYVTENSPSASDSIGKLAGIYELSHVKGRKEEFLSERQKQRFTPDQWPYSLRANRAWEILPEFRKPMREIYPDLYEGRRAQAVSRFGEKLPLEVFEQIKRMPMREVPVFGLERQINQEIFYTSKASKSKRKGYVGGGASNQSGYYVPPESDSEKSLYLLKLKGDASVWLGRDAAQHDIYKIGLSISPQTRCDCFNYAMPEGVFSWEVERTTLLDGHPMYADFKIAEKGEMAMKKYLAQTLENHLGGEFYLANESSIKSAWDIGRQACLSAMKDNNG